METVATCFTTDGNDSYHGLAPSFFEEMTRCRRQKHCRRRPDNPNSPSKIRKYRVNLSLLHLFTSARSRLLFRGWRQLPRTRTVVFRRDDTLPTLKTSLEMTRQPNGRSIFRNLVLFTFTRSQLTLHGGSAAGWWLPEIAQTARNRRQNIAGTTRINRDTTNTKIYAKGSSKTSRNTSFLRLRTTPRLTALRTVFFLLSLATAFVFTFQKSFLDDLDPTEKPRYTYYSFFVDSIYSKTIHIIGKK